METMSTIAQSPIFKMQAYIIPEIPKFSEFYSTIPIATNEANGDRLYVIDGNISEFESDHPDSFPYYDADWFQNFCPDFPGDTPLEKYLNAINNMTTPNPPKWNNILPVIASSSFFAKLLTTQNSNAFSALQTVVQYRNMELFQSLAKATLEAIPGGLSQEEIEELESILEANNFPLFD